MSSYVDRVFADGQADKSKSKFPLKVGANDKPTVRSFKGNPNILSIKILVSYHLQVFVHTCKRCYILKTCWCDVKPNIKKISRNTFLITD